MGKKKTEAKEQEYRAELEKEKQAVQSEQEESKMVMDYEGIMVNVKNTDSFHLMESRDRHIGTILSFLRLLMGANTSRYGSDDLAGHMIGVLHEMETKLEYIDDISEELGDRLLQAEKEKAA